MNYHHIDFDKQRLTQPWINKFSVYLRKGYTENTAEHSVPQQGQQQLRQQLPCTRAETAQQAQTTTAQQQPEEQEQQVPKASGASMMMNTTQSQPRQADNTQLTSNKAVMTPEGQTGLSTRRNEANIQAMTARQAASAPTQTQCAMTPPTTTKGQSRTPRTAGMMTYSALQLRSTRAAGGQVTTEQGSGSTSDYGTRQ